MKRFAVFYKDNRELIGSDSYIPVDVRLNILNSKTYVYDLP